MKQINASIITIGDELLIGQTIDTNSAFIAQELNKIGIWVKRRIAVGDVKEEILNALKEQSKDCSVIIITGGLGPTADDITKPTLCEYFDSKLIVDKAALQNVKDIFTKLNRPMIERNLKQAEVPDKCTVLQNKRGTAPGMWFGPSPTITLKMQDGASSPSRREGDEEPESLVEEETVGYRYADPVVYGLLKEFALMHRLNPTQAEDVLWNLLRSKQLEGYKFRRQHIIDRFIADFVCLKQKLIVEIDGLIHQLPENQASDQQRTERLNKLDFEVIHFTNEKVLNETDQVLNDILSALKKQQEKKSISDLSSPSTDGGQGAVYISLPGVPHEMKGLMNDSVIPKLKEVFELPAVLHRTLLTSGIGESMLADAIIDFENNLPSHVKLAYLPAYGMVRLRLTARGNDKDAIEKELDNLFAQLKSLVAKWMVADEDISLQEAVIRLLKSKKKTISTAESCTGGNIAHLITSIAGSSVVYNGSVVSYANEAKENLLGVKEETLKQFGAVSEQTVTEMIHGALKELKTDYAIATSGIMGPDGGTAEKPVGTVWIAVGNNQNIKASKHFFRFDRARNIELTTHTALTMLYRFVKEQ